jgi:small subunit ribosomal protein S14
MAKTSIIHREKNRKYDIRVRQRCRVCGRPRGYMRRFDMCRICFRAAALKGELPGVVKSSW